MIKIPTKKILSIFKDKVNFASLEKTINKKKLKNISLLKLKTNLKDRLIKIKPNLIVQNIQDKIEKLNIIEDNLVLLK